MISKKDLLQEMKISYGQLYRWKREGLIPESWFIKQSTITGQETYFQRDLIIPRIQKIIELKDKYQIDELKKFFSPSDFSTNYTIRDAVIIDEIDPILIKLYIVNRNKKKLSIIELAIIFILSINQDLIEFEKYAKYDFSQIKDPDLTIYILKDSEDRNFLMIFAKEGFIDPQLQILKKIRLEDAITSIADKLKEEK